MERLPVNELKDLSNELRAYCLTAITAANSGHPGSCLSSMDMLTALYFNKLNHNPKNPNDDSRDRVFIDKGHLAPAVYVTMAKAGYFNIEDVIKGFRKFDSPYQGHPNMLMLPSVEISQNSLGQVLGVAVGSALSAKLKNQSHQIYCFMGDGSQQEGNIWESAMSASHYNLDNLTGIVDVNNLQIDDFTKEVMNIESISEKYKAFGWEVIEIDGHNLEQILDSFDQAQKTQGKPTAIIANTIKGKGVSFIENKVEWHSKPPNYEQLKQALKDLNQENLPYDFLLKKSQKYTEKIEKKLKEAMPQFEKDYWWNSQEEMKVEMKATNQGVFDCLEKIGDDERIVIVPADSYKMVAKGFTNNHPERKNRVFNVGIAEQNMAVVTAGLAKEGLIPVMGAYSVFSPGKNLDQIRTSIAICNLNAKIIGVGGLVGEDGAGHEGLEEIALTESLPNMNVSIPSDIIETEKAVRENILNIKGPCFIRVGKIKFPVITKQDTPYQFGTANIIRYREKQDNFIDAFETQLSTNYKNEGEQLSIVACGVEVSEAMRAAYILKEQENLETRIINMHTIKPLDKTALLDAAKQTKLILTAEEHQRGGLGNLVAGAISYLYEKPRIEMIGVKDRFGESGTPYQLMQHLGLTAEYIAERALKSLK